VTASGVMKRNIPGDGPSSTLHSLFPRDGNEPKAKKGGRTLKNEDCFEKGAEKGSAKCFFSRKNAKGEELEGGVACPTSIKMRSL